MSDITVQILINIREEIARLSAASRDSTQLAIESRDASVRVDKELTILSTRVATREDIARVGERLDRIERDLGVTARAVLRMQEPITNITIRHEDLMAELERRVEHLETLAAKP